MYPYDAIFGRCPSFKGHFQSPPRRVHAIRFDSIRSVFHRCPTARGGGTCTTATWPMEAAACSTENCWSSCCRGSAPMCTHARTASHWSRARLYVSFCRYRFPFGFNSKATWLRGLIKPASTFSFHQTLRINNKTEPPPTWGGWAGSAYTVNLYPNPTAPLIPLYSKSPVGGNR
jgi:hypothetical protein